jgi:hypothetical protein
VARGSENMFCDLGHKNADAERFKAILLKRKKEKLFRLLSLSFRHNIALLCLEAS